MANFIVQFSIFIFITRICLGDLLLPKDCQEVRKYLVSVGSCKLLDGEYLLNLTSLFPEATAPVLRSIYCHGMNKSNPKSYLTLRAGPEVNFAYSYKKRVGGKGSDSCAYNGNAAINKNSGHTKFHKIGFDLQNMTVRRYDFLFSATSGIKKRAYGLASDCYDRNLNRNPKGTLSVNLTGTGFRVDDKVTWMTAWHQAEMEDYNISSNREIVSAKCGGWPGACEPMVGDEKLLILSYNSAFVIEAESVDYRTVSLHETFRAGRYRKSESVSGNDGSCAVEASSRIRCALRCMEDPLCKWYDYNKKEKSCFINSGSGMNLVP